MSPPSLRFAAFVCFSAASAAAAAPVLAKRYSLRDGGQLRAFETVAETRGVALYEFGKERKESTRRLVTPGVLVRLENPADAAGLAAKSGARSWKPAPVLAGAVIFTFDGNTGEALPAAEALRAMKGVRSAEPLLARQQVKRWTPNDPFFAWNASKIGRAHV